MILFAWLTLLSFDVHASLPKEQSGEVYRGDEKLGEIYYQKIVSDPENYEFEEWEEGTQVASLDTMVPSDIPTIIDADAIFTFAIEGSITQWVAANIGLVLGNISYSDIGDIYHGFVIGVTPGARAVKTGIGYAFQLGVDEYSVGNDTYFLDPFTAFFGLSARFNYMYAYDFRNEQGLDYLQPGAHYIGAELAVALWIFRLSGGVYNKLVKDPDFKNYDDVVVHFGAGLGAP